MQNLFNSKLLFYETSTPVTQLYPLMSMRVAILFFFLFLTQGISGQQLHETPVNITTVEGDTISPELTFKDSLTGVSDDVLGSSGGDGDDDDDGSGDDDSDDDSGDDDDDGSGDDDSDDDSGDDDDDLDDDDLEIIIHPTLYFVKLDPAIPDDSVDALLANMNSEEVWYLEEIGLRLWNVFQFPYVDENGQAVSSINEHVSRARKKTRINDSNFNVGFGINPYSEGVQNLCLGLEPMATPTGDNSVVISIFDTGLSDPGAAGGEYSFAIEDYSGYDYVNDDDNPEDENGHGTRIAGIINHIIALNDLSDRVEFDIRKTHNAQGQGFLSNLIPAIVDAVNDGSNVLNMSFSYKDYRHDTVCNPIELALEYARQNDVLVVTSSGNEAKDNDSGEITIFPASLPGDNILAVTSHNCSHQLSDFGNYGAQSVDIAVIGEFIPGPGSNGNVVFSDGTSYAAAMASAMAAIMGTHLEDFSPERIICGLVTTSSYESSLDGKVVANGYVDFQAAYNGLGESCPANGEVISSTSELSPSEDIYLEVMPNPVIGGNARFIYRTDKYESVLIRIIDQSGMTHSVTQYAAVPGENNFKLDISRVRGNGMYILQAISPTSAHSVSFLRH